MHTQIRTAPFAISAPQSDRPTSAKHARRAVRMVLIAAVAFAVGWGTWGLLRVEFAETLHMISMYSSTMTAIAA